jgi:hypothetical protein
MQNQNLSFEEFKALFQDSFDSHEELVAEYNSFLKTFDRLDEMPVPDLSYREKSKIFRESWQERPQEPSNLFMLINFFRRPVVTFVLGIVIGFFLVSTVRSDKPEPSLPIKESPDELLTIERTEYVQTYKGKIIKELYPQFENPKIVIEKAEETSEPHRVLHGTLDDGEIYVVWNL